MKIILLNGSPAEISRSRAILDYLDSLFKEQGSDSKIIDLKLAHLPINDPRLHADAMKSADENVRRFAQAVKDADVVVLSTPLYHGSYSGLLKLALDNLDGDAFAGKKILICSNSSGPRNSMQAAQELVIVGRTMGGTVCERLVGTFKKDYEETGKETVLVNEQIKNRCKEIVADLA